MAALTFDGVNKAFGPTLALSDVSFAIAPGEIHALLGENGAGKSTLLSIVAGLISADSGTITLGGARYAPRSAHDARNAGIAIVPQEPMLAAALTVRENVTLGREPTRFGLVDQRAARRITERALRSLAAAIDPDALTSSLSPAEWQIVAIARALSQASARVVILDEPTSSLSRSDAERVLGAARKLAESGATVVYVSHHLAEVKAVADRFTVLRAGKVVHTGAVADVGVVEMAELILGRPVEAAVRPPRAIGEVLLTVASVAGERLPSDVSFELRRGEILGIAGLVGAGRTELCRALFGLDAVRRGSIKLRAWGTDHGVPPWARLAGGVGMVSEDRKGEGLVQTMSLADNITLSALGRVSRFGIVSRRAQREAALRFIERLAIRASGPDAQASSLSGGNQQKVAIGRLLFHDVDVFLLDEPTRGIDPGSREALYRLFEQLAHEGKAILWISSQTEELMRVCDRIAVMVRGQLREAKATSALDEASLLRDLSGEAPSAPS